MLKRVRSWLNDGREGGKRIWRVAYTRDERRRGQRRRREGAVKDMRASGPDIAGTRRVKDEC